MSDTFLISQTFRVQTCCTCGIDFAMTCAHEDRLRETHEWFYCPHGHKQCYTGKTDAENLRVELAATVASLERSRAYGRRRGEMLHHAERRLSATKGVVTRIKNRVSKGVCPCCNRTFKDLARHMKTRHPDFADAGGA